MGMRGVILLGDPTSSGGRIISASGFMTVDGKPVACVGDKATCPIDGHGGTVTIVEGSSSDIMMGRPFAYDGCALSCGCHAMSTTTRFMLEPNRGMKSPLKSKVAAVKSIAVTPANSDAYRDLSIPLRGANSDAYRDRHAPVIEDNLEVVPGSELKKRRDYVKKGGGAIFPIASNPNTNAGEPIIEIKAFNNINQYSKQIDRIAFQYKIDPDLVRSIMYMEETHGYYDYALLGHQRTILPMNVHSALWEDFVGTREQLFDPEYNIGAGSKILAGIQNNLAPADRTVPKLATLYNSLGATQVNDYGARVAAIYQQKPWLAKL